MMHANLFQDAEKNQSFLKMIFTGKSGQLGLMNLKPGEEILYGRSKADIVFLILGGTGMAEVEGQERPVEKGSAVYVTAGARHNLVNVGEDDLKIAVLYAPAIYPEDASFGTRARAAADPFTDITDL